MHVIDPALVLGDAWDRVWRLRVAAVDRHVAADCDPSSIREMLLESIKGDPVFVSVEPRLDDEFIESWVSAGYSLAAAEGELGTTPEPGSLCSTASAAMTAVTLDLETPGLVMAAQCIVRDSYVAARMRWQGPTTAHLDFESHMPDFRLSLMRHPWHLAHEWIDGWVSRIPLPSTTRDPWLNTLANAAVDGDQEFAGAVIAANRMLCDLADKMSGKESAVRSG